MKIAPGELAKYWEDCLKNSFICVGWDEVGDLAEFEAKEAFREAFRRALPVQRRRSGRQSQSPTSCGLCWSYEPGDKVIANRGTSEVLAVGTVNDDGYKWRPEREEYRHTLGVDWDTSVRRGSQPVKAWATTTV